MAAQLAGQLAEHPRSRAATWKGGFRARKRVLPIGAAILPALLFALLLALYAGPVNAATLTVCPTSGPYATIQQAVNAANADDVIEICAGTYAESVNLALMGSDGGSQGNITLVGVGEVLISPPTGSALFLDPNANFNGNIVLDNINATSPDADAISFSFVGGSLTVNGGSASNAGSVSQGGVELGLSAGDVAGTITISGTSFLNNEGKGAQVASYTGSGSCAEPPASPIVSLIGATAAGNGMQGFVVYAAYGDVRIDSSQATTNTAQGFNVLYLSPCEGNTVFVDGSRAEANGGDGFDIVAPNLRVADSSALSNGSTGITQNSNQLGFTAAADVSPAAAAAVPPSAQILRTSVDGNGWNGVFVEGSDSVTISHVSAIGNANYGIGLALPFDSPTEQWFAIDSSLVKDNQVGIALQDAGEPPPLGIAATAAVTTEIGGNILCANTLAGVQSLDNEGRSFNAARNYWGSPSGPYHAVKNPTGTGDPVIDSTSGGGIGDVLFTPWVVAAITGPPTSWLVGVQQMFTVTFPAGGGPGLTSNPGSSADAPLFNVGTNNGVLKTAYGEGAVAPAALDASGYFTALLTPSTGGVATVSVSGPCGLLGTAAVPIAVPSVVISKNPPLQAVVNGGSATFQVTVTNTGDVGLTDILVSDPAAPLCGRSLSDLDPGQSANFTCEQGGVTASYTNQITVTANAGATPLPRALGAAALAPVTATASAQVIVVNPGLSAVKSVGLDPNACAPAGPLTAPISSSLYYCVTLSNTGDVTLTNHLITDTLLGIEGAAISYPLAPGASVPITRSLVPQLGPVLMTGTLTNVVTVTSIGQVSEIGGAPVPTIGVRAESAGSVSARPQPTDLEVEPEPVDATRWLYLPTLRR